MAIITLIQVSFCGDYHCQVCGQIHYHYQFCRCTCSDHVYIVGLSVHLWHLQCKYVTGCSTANSFVHAQSTCMYKMYIHKCFTQCTFTRTKPSYMQHNMQPVNLLFCAYIYRSMLLQTPVCMYVHVCIRQLCIYYMYHLRNM